MSPSRVSRRTSSNGSSASGSDHYDEDEVSLQEPLIDDLDDEYNFQPQPGDSVWVKSKGEDETWYLGIVMKGSTKIGPVRQGLSGTFWPVKYRHNLRRHFAPLLGDIKPDTPRVRQLLKETGVNVEFEL